ncbi:MAG: sporulation protein YunB [Ruminococcus sp.]|nr:sporulation protein YunB [Ruminococcus sp.]
MRRRRKRRHNTRGITGAFILIVIVVLLILSMARLDKAVRPAAELQAQQLSQKTASIIINDVISQYIAKNEYTYSDFAAVLYDESGHASAVEALSENINRVQAELTAEINRQLNTSGESNAEISLGSLSGSYLLAGKGPTVKVRICPVGSAEVRLTSTFDSAGINQTRHRIYAEISADMVSATTLYSFDTNVKFDYLLAETVIIGDVPQFTAKAWNAL